MRILHVIQELGPGGAEQVVRQLCEASRARGDAVAVACAGSPTLPEDVTWTPLPMLGRRPQRTLAAAWRIRRFASSWQPDIIHAHNPGMAMATALAVRRGATCPALVTLHGVPPEDDRATARLLRWTQLPVVACGAGVAAALRAHRLEPLTTISNGVPAPPPAADPAALRRDLELDARAPLVMAVGRLVAQKRHDLAVAAAALLPGTSWVIVGDGPLRPALERQVSDLGLAPRVRVLGARPDARSLLAAADVVTQPSDWEGLPLVVLEAMRARRPVVATTAPGLRELLDDGVDSLLVPPGDAPALAAAVARVLTDNGLAQRIAAAAAARAEREFSEEAMVTAYRLVWQWLSTRRVRTPSG